MYRKISDFLEDWGQEFQSTKNLIALLSDNELNFSPSKNIRPIGDLVFHIVGTPGTLITEMGFSNNMLNWYSDPIESIEGLVENFVKSNIELIDIISKWTDNDLEEQVSVLGGSYKKGYILSTLLIGHQAHHRGQLTILMRLKNLKLIEMYGPTYESWVEMGEEPMK